MAFFDFFHYYYTNVLYKSLPIKLIVAVHFSLLKITLTSVDGKTTKRKERIFYLFRAWISGKQSKSYFVKRITTIPNSNKCTKKFERVPLFHEQYSTDDGNRTIIIIIITITIPSDSQRVICILYLRFCKFHFEFDVRTKNNKCLTNIYLNRCHVMSN